MGESAKSLVNRKCGGRTLRFDSCSRSKSILIKYKKIIGITDYYKFQFLFLFLFAILSIINIPNGTSAAIQHHIAPTTLVSLYLI